MWELHNYNTAGWLLTYLLFTTWSWRLFFLFNTFIHHIHLETLKHISLHSSLLIDEIIAILTILNIDYGQLLSHNYNGPDHSYYLIWLLIHFACFIIGYIPLTFPLMPWNTGIPLNILSYTENTPWLTKFGCTHLSTLHNLK